MEIITIIRCIPIVFSEISIGLLLTIRNNATEKKKTKILPVYSPEQVTPSLLKRFFPKLKSGITITYTKHQIEKMLKALVSKEQHIDFDNIHLYGWINQDNKLVFSKYIKKLYPLVIDNSLKEVFVPLVLYNLLSIISTPLYKTAVM